MEKLRNDESKLNLKATELRLGLSVSDDLLEEEPPTARINNKRAPLSMAGDESRSSEAEKSERDDAPSSKARVVGWPPVRSFRKNRFQSKKTGAGNGTYVKVSMDGAPYLRKVDLNVYNGGYPELLKALEDMFRIIIGEYSERDGYHGSEYALTFEDKDGDWMLVGDVPWEMFTTSCKKLRITKGSEARGLGCL